MTFCITQTRLFLCASCMSYVREMGAIKRPSRPRTVLLGVLASISSILGNPPVSVSLLVY